ncbi:MAG: Lactoylglutathione lyase [Myxococcaceae bacterium]|nr:Lactoylglutathione lyase [Myxococcaceae bacterium]
MLRARRVAKPSGARPFTLRSDRVSAQVQHRAMAPLHHLALRTHDLERLLAFYLRWFGLPVERDARPRSVWLKLEPGAVLMIERAEANEPRPPAGSQELLCFALSIGERVRLREALVAADMLEGETEHTLYFRDPDGRKVGVSSYPL